jgi:hypothetical protein
MRCDTRGEGRGRWARASEVRNGGDHLFQPCFENQCRDSCAERPTHCIRQVRQVLTYASRMLAATSVQEVGMSVAVVRLVILAAARHVVAAAAGAGDINVKRYDSSTLTLSYYIEDGV